MATYLIGDVHGCYKALTRLLERIKFTPNKDDLWLTGDLVFRGPKSLEVLRYVKSLGKSVRVVLGNHDLNLLAIHAGINKFRITNSNIMLLFKAPDIDELLDWLRFQPVLHVDEQKKLVMTHAGITPQWNLDTAKKCACEIEKVLTSSRNGRYLFFLKYIYNDTANDWSDDLKGLKRLQFIFNAFTRMRYCFPNGRLCFLYPKQQKNVSILIKPWFVMPRLIDQEYSIVFGHWSLLNGKGTPNGIYAIDTGCCWGKTLTCLRWEDKMYFSSSEYENL